MIDLGTLGGSFSDAVDINGAGQVGTSRTASGSEHAFVTGPHGGTGMMDLNGASA